MNKLHRTVWNQCTQTWVAVSEHAKSQTKRSSTSLTVIAGLLGVILFGQTAQAEAGSYEYQLYQNGVSTPTDGDSPIMIYDDTFMHPDYINSDQDGDSPIMIDDDTFMPPDYINSDQDGDSPIMIDDDTCMHPDAWMTYPKCHKPEVTIEDSCMDSDTWMTNPKCHKPEVVYRPSVALYVSAQSANADAGFLQLSTLHQRMGEQRGLSTEKPQTWGRIIAGGVSNNGKNRFEYDQRTAGFQFGRDLMAEATTQGTQKRAGVTVQYAYSSMDARDRVRPLVNLGEDTGSMSAVSYGLGGYYTRMTQEGAYLDVVSQVNRLRNKFADSYGGRSRQMGWQMGLSAEVGKPVAQIKEWKIEPQAQLSYLYNKYSSFSDTYSNIDGFSAHQLRARLGLRLNRDTTINGSTAHYYGIVNLHHDLLKPKTIHLSDRVGTGTASVSEPRGGSVSLNS
jgi:outer membrane autotransporter protein